MTLPLLSSWPAVADAEPPRPLRLAALDLSLQATGTAATHTPDGHPELTTSTIRPRTDGHQRLQDIVTGVARLTRFMPQLVLIERLPLQYKHGNTTARLAELHALVKQWLWTMGLPYLLINPGHLKIYATGKGDAPKDDVRRAMQHRYPVYVQTSDEADALAMLCLAMHAYGQPVADVPDTHHRAVGMVQWPPLPELAGGAHLAPRSDPPPAAAVDEIPAAGGARAYRRRLPLPGQPNGRPRASQRTCAGVVDALRQRRIHLGLSAVDVARAMGVSPRSVYAWEDGARSPDAHALERYAEAVSTTLLIGPVTDVDHVAVERVAAGTAPWRSLNHDERHAAFTLLRDRGGFAAAGWTAAWAAIRDEVK